eukprot:2422942-Prymnesium_polylepis.1
MLRARQWLHQPRCAHVGGRGRTNLRSSRRSCRGRWLLTGRSEPRAPGGVGWGSRRRMSPPPLPASARAQSERLNHRPSWAAACCAARNELFVPGRARCRGERAV